MHPAALPIDELLKNCELRRQRRSGPGGQHRNKVETGIVVTHLATGVRAEATERRSQDQNRRVALFRLRVKLALEVRENTGGRMSPSNLWRSRTSGGRIAVSSRHEDYPALLAEALDVLAAKQYDVTSAAKILDVSNSQLTKFLKLESAALQQVNDARREAGFGALR